MLFVSYSKRSTELSSLHSDKSTLKFHAASIHLGLITVASITVQDMKCNSVTFTKCLFSCLPGSGHNGYSRQLVLLTFYMLSSLYLMYILFEAKVFKGTSTLTTE